MPRRGSPATGAGAPRPASKPRARPAGGASLQALRDEVAELKKALADALADVPRAEDFQPLADHLYDFARQAPALVESLRALPQAVGPLEDAARALEEVSQALHDTCETFGESLLRLPRAEDYEPLVVPLREFARVAPALAEQLATVMRSVSPLEQAVGTLRETAERLQQAAAAGAGSDALRAAAERMAEAERAIRAALASLPRDRAYARVAGQLKELASVSPSLAEWLREVPRLSMPLGESIEALERAAESLAEGAAAARAGIAPPRRGARREGASRRG